MAVLDGQDWRNVSVGQTVFKLNQLSSSMSLQHSGGITLGFWSKRSKAEGFCRSLIPKTNLLSIEVKVE